MPIDIPSSGAHIHHMTKKNPRLSVTFTKRQLVFLEREAARLGISIAETVRRIVDFHIERKEK
jgi:hypothetical protein